MNLIDRFLDFFKLLEVKALDATNERRASGSWTRRVPFNPFPQSCEEEETAPETEECEVEEEEEEDCEEECPPSVLTRKLGCMATGAKRGLKEGALTGVFFGGGWGLYKYIDTVYIKGEGGGSEKRGSQDDQGGSGGDDDSTVNDNVIFVSACNSAILMGVLCTIIGSLKNSIYCN